MARKCTICTHAEAETISQELIKGTSYREIAGRFNVSKSALERHKEKHLPAALVKAQEATEITAADSLIDQIESLRIKALYLLTQAERAGDLKTALQGIAQARSCIELLAKIRGELAQEGAVNITISAEWIELRAVILQALDHYPEARGAVAEALKGVDPNVSS